MLLSSTLSRTIFYCDDLIINNDENDTSAANLIFLYLCISVADTRAFYMISNYWENPFPIQFVVNHDRSQDIFFQLGRNLTRTSFFYLDDKKPRNKTSKGSWKHLSGCKIIVILGHADNAEKVIQTK